MVSIERVVSVQRSKSIPKELLGPNQVTFIERVGQIKINSKGAFVTHREQIRVPFLLTPSFFRISW